MRLVRVRIDFERALNDRYYFERVIDDLEADIISGDDLDRDRLMGFLGVMKELNSIRRSPGR